MASEVADKKPKNRLYLTKPYAMRIREVPDPAAGLLAYQTLTSVIVGGEPIGFDGNEKKVVISDQRFDARQWMELRHRIDMVFQRAGCLEQVSPPKGELDSVSGHFFTRNWRAIGEHRVGTWKNPPWWLRWLYSAVITKEVHGY